MPIPEPPQPSASNSNRSWLFGMIIACLAVFGVIIVADYFVQRMAHEAHQPVTISAPSPAQTASPSPAPTVTAAPTAEPNPKTKPGDDFEDYVVRPTPDPYDDVIAAALEKPANKSSPTPDDDEKYIRDAEPDPTAMPTPRPTLRATPRNELVVSASDILQVSSYGGKSQDSRLYRFRLDGIARVKGSFSASGGGVSVRIVSGGRTHYSSGDEVSADAIDVALYSGTYEVEVTLRSQDTVSFQVRLIAYYNP